MTVMRLPLSDFGKGFIVCIRTSMARRFRGVPRQ